MKKKTFYFTLTNNRCKVEGNMKALLKLYKEDSLKVKHPNAYFLRAHMAPGWDGFICSINERGYFQIGHLPNIIDWIKNQGYSYSIIDNRLKLKTNDIPKKIGDKTPRAYQVEAVSSVINRKIKKLSFPIGVLNCATNAGKTLMMTMIHLTIKDARSVMIINDGDLFEQFKQELPELLGKDKVGFVRGKDNDWKEFTVCMVQTLSRNIHKYKSELIKANVCLVDEADLADNKTYKKVLQHMYNTTCRVGLSGTIYMSKLAKDRVKNQNLRGFFSTTSYTITKKEMVEKGHSTKLVIKIVPGNTKPYPIKTKNWMEVYDALITNNHERHINTLNRLKYNIDYDRLPALVVCRLHNHIDQLYELFNQELGHKYKVEYIHSDIPKKKKKDIFNRFREGEIDILISSYIVRRGKNFPLIRYILNASGSDSNETISQLMGRGERYHKDKTKTVMDDLYDIGDYIERHSKHRINYYKKEGFKVIKLV